MRAETIGVRASTTRAVRIVVVVRIAVEHEVVAAILDEDAGAHVVMGIDLLEDVVASRDPDTPGLVVQIVVLRDALDTQSLEVQVAAGNVEALDPAVVRQVREVEDWR